MGSTLNPKLDLLDSVCKFVYTLTQNAYFDDEHLLKYGVTEKTLRIVCWKILAGRIPVDYLTPKSVSEFAENIADALEGSSVTIEDVVENIGVIPLSVCKGKDESFLISCITIQLGHIPIQVIRDHIPYSYTSPYMNIQPLYHRVIYWLFFPNMDYNFYSVWTGHYTDQDILISDNGLGEIPYQNTEELLEHYKSFRPYFKASEYYSLLTCVPSIQDLGWYYNDNEVDVLTINGYSYISSDFTDIIFKFDCFNDSDPVAFNLPLFVTDNYTDKLTDYFQYLPDTTAEILGVLEDEFTSDRYEGVNIPVPRIFFMSRNKVIKPLFAYFGIIYAGALGTLESSPSAYEPFVKKDKKLYKEIKERIKEPGYCFSIHNNVKWFYKYALKRSHVFSDYINFFARAWEGYYKDRVKCYTSFNTSCFWEDSSVAAFISYYCYHLYSKYGK